MRFRFAPQGVRQWLAALGRLLVLIVVLMSSLLALLKMPGSSFSGPLAKLSNEEQRCADAEACGGGEAEAARDPATALPLRQQAAQERDACGRERREQQERRRRAERSAGTPSAMRGLCWMKRRPSIWSSSLSVLPLIKTSSMKDRTISRLSSVLPRSTALAGPSTML